MSPLVSALPRRSCVALRSKHDKQSYLRTVHDESHGGNIVELSADGGIMNPRCRFYLEPSKEHGGLVHVRCCYNNKYWVPQQRVLHLRGGGSAPSWIIGTADKPEEDLSKPSCTLFKHTAVAGGEEEEGYTRRFLHSHLGKYVGVSSSSTTTSSDTSTMMRPYLHVAAHEEEAHLQDNNDHLMDAFTVIDVSEQKLLPKYLAFKGDNGQFLGGVKLGPFNYLQFSKQDVGDATVLQTVCTTEQDGVVRFKNNHFDMFWKRSPNWIRADSDDTTDGNPDTLFKVITGDDFVALQNLGNNLFCVRLTKDGNADCLNADVHSITKEARLQCHEPLVSRRIYDVDFRTDEARIYTTSVEGLDTQSVTNKTDTAIHTTLEFTYIRTLETTWSSTVSMKFGLTVELQCGVPLVFDENVSISSEFNGSYEWGETVSETKQVTRSIAIEVPPMKKVTGTAVGTNGVCDIPFSYTQRDILLNGEAKEQRFPDGLYVGVKTSGVDFIVTDEDL